jgi:signal transduction histidine kinase
VESLLAQIRALRQTVSDLLDRDQLSRRRLDVEWKEVSLPHCLAEIEQSVRSKVAAQQVQLAVKYLPLSPDRVTTDVRLLVQAGRNLVYHLLAQTQAHEIKVRVGRKDPTHWMLHVTDYDDAALPYGPLLAQAALITPTATVNWLLAEQIVSALQGDLQVGQSGAGQILIQAVFALEPPGGKLN